MLSAIWVASAAEEGLVPPHNMRQCPFLRALGVEPNFRVQPQTSQSIRSSAPAPFPNIFLCSAQTLKNFFPQFRNACKKFFAHLKPLALSIIWPCKTEEFYELSSDSSERRDHCLLHLAHLLAKVLISPCRVTLSTASFCISIQNYLLSTDNARFSNNIFTQILF